MYIIEIDNILYRNTIKVKEEEANNSCVIYTLFVTASFIICEEYCYLKYKKTPKLGAVMS